MREPQVTILARNMRLKGSLLPKPWILLQVPLATVLAREMRLKESFCPSRGYVVRAASHDSDVRNAIEICLKLTKL